jgi:hypothetical protein
MKNYILFFLLLSLTTVSCSLKPQFSDRRSFPDVAYGVSEPFGLGWAAAHAPVNNWIKVGKFHLEHLSGREPFFFRVDGSRLLLAFQTIKRSMKVQLLIIDPERNSLKRVDGPWELFYDVKARVVAPDRIRISYNSLRWDEYAIVDVNEQRIIEHKARRLP